MKRSVFSHLENPKHSILRKKASLYLLSFAKNKIRRTMKRKNLFDYLNEHKSIQNGMLVKSSLIDKLEIVGFLNDTEPMNFINNACELSLHTDGSINFLNMLALYSGFVKTGNNTYEYYMSLTLNESRMEINIENLYIPSLMTKDLYKYIRKRNNTRKITDELLRQKNFPTSIIAKDNAAIRVIEEGEIVMKDRIGKVKSIAEDVVAICRYINNATGMVSYTMLPINDLYIEE